MPRILLLITDLEIGGTPTVVRELALRLHRLIGESASDSVEVACLAKRGPVAAQIAEAGVRVTPLDASGPRNLAVLRRLHRLIRDRQIDTLLSFLIHANTAAAVVNSFNPALRLIQSIQTTQPQPRWHWRLQGLVHHAAETIVVPSRSIVEAASSWAGIPRAKFQVIPNAIDPADYRSLDTQRRQPSSIGFIGRLDPIKRVPDLLEALALLHDPPPTLNIYGDGPERQAIEAEVSRLRLGTAVVMNGAIRDPRMALGSMGVLVLPSEAEGFGLVLIEAMAAGVPVIATNVPGIRDVVTHGETGLLVPPAQPSALASAIETVMTDQSLRERLVRNGLAKVRRRFTWDVVLPRYLELLHVARATSP